MKYKTYDIGLFEYVTRDKKPAYYRFSCGGYTYVNESLDDLISEVMSSGIIQFTIANINIDRLKMSKQR